MTVEVLLTQLTRIVFIALFALTLLDFLHHRDKIRRDIAVMFACVAMPTLIAVFRAVFGLPEQWLGSVGAVILLAQPYLLLRLVGYFRAVPSVLTKGALLGIIAAWIIIILVGTPLPNIVTLTLVAYFVLIDGYAVFAFIQGAFFSAGVTRNRLRFAAFGSAALVLVLLLSGIRVAIPALTQALFPFIQLAAVLSGLAYYLGFAPPRWLRQAWQNTELRDYLAHIQKHSAQGLPEIIDRLYLAVTRAMDTQTVAFGLWDKDSQQLIFQKTSRSPFLLDFPLSGIVHRAWQDATPLVIYKTQALEPEDLRLMEMLHVESMVSVPIATTERPLGLLLVFLEYGSLFIDDDLELLTIFAQQKAVLLENHSMLEELHHHNEALEKKVQERTAALQRSNEELRRYAYVASHDLQEPLRMVSSYLQLIEQRFADKLDEEGREFIAFAVGGALRMKNLITDLLLYSRVETQSRNFALIDLQQVLDKTLQLLEVTIKETGASITNEALPQLNADEELMLQLFQNLIGNAIKYRSTRKPEIHISAICEDDQWIFSIRDNGIGIEPQYLERIFVIFQRLHGSNEYPGTGIGLAICKKAVELHDGRIWAEAEMGTGTTFYFTIPARKLS